MPRAAKGGRYHHGDLRAALVDTAIEVIGERGVRGFSLAEASRRLGVAVSAPYAHFADRDELLAAVAVHAYELFAAELVPRMGQFETPADRLATMARSYVRFAAANRPLFEVLYEAGLDKARHPEIEAAERPLADAFMACVRAISGGENPSEPDGPEAPSEELATALEATALGHVMLFLDGGSGQAGDGGSGERGDGCSGQGGDAVELAAERAARATFALIESRHLLGRPSGAPGTQPSGRRSMITEDPAGRSVPDPP